MNSRIPYAKPSITELHARFQDPTLEEILTMLGELTPLEQTRAYREIVAKNQPIWRHEGEAHLVLRQLRRRKPIER